MKCEACGAKSSSQVWGHSLCNACVVEIARVWPESGEAEAKYPDELERYEAYRKFADAWLAKRKARAA